MSLTSNVYFVNGSMEGKCIAIFKDFTQYMVAKPPNIDHSVEETLIIHKDGSEEWYDVIRDTPIRVDTEKYSINNNFSYGDNTIRIGEIEDRLDNSLSVHEITLKLFKLFPELRANLQSLYSYVTENNRATYTGYINTQTLRDGLFNYSQSVAESVTNNGMLHRELTEERLRGVINDLYYREAPQYPFTNAEYNVFHDPDFRRLYNDNIDFARRTLFNSNQIIRDYDPSVVRMETSIDLTDNDRTNNSNNS